MNATAGGSAALSAKDENPVSLAGRDGVLAALAAERDLLDGLIAAAQAAVNGNPAPVGEFIERYWLIPLQQDRTATAQWLEDLQAGNEESVREAADEELHLARCFRRLAKGLGTEYDKQPTLAAALASYDFDFRTEVEGKRSILDAL